MNNNLLAAIYLNTAFQDTQIFDQVTLTTAETEYRLTDVNLPGYLIVKALSSNSGVVYIGGDGTRSSNGFPLAKGEEAVISSKNLSLWRAIGVTDGNKVSVLGAYVSTYKESVHLLNSYKG